MVVVVSMVVDVVVDAMVVHLGPFHPADVGHPSHLVLCPNHLALCPIQPMAGLSLFLHPPLDLPRGGIPTGSVSLGGGTNNASYVGIVCESSFH